MPLKGRCAARDIHKARALTEDGVRVKEGLWASHKALSMALRAALHKYLPRTMEGGLASSWHDLHLSALQLLPADLEVSLCASLANGVDRLMLYNMKNFQCPLLCSQYALMCLSGVKISDGRSHL